MTFPRSIEGAERIADDWTGIARRRPGGMTFLERTGQRSAWSGGPAGRRRDSAAGDLRGAGTKPGSTAITVTPVGTPQGGPPAVAGDPPTGAESGKQRTYLVS